MDGFKIAIDKFWDKFISFFDKKIIKLVEEVRIDNDVYYGNKNVNADELIFVDTVSINHSLLSLKNKKLRRYG